MPFLYGLPSIEGLQVKVAEQHHTKPLSYFESWCQTHRYGGTSGTLLLDFGKRQMPKLGGKISKRLTECVHDFISPLSGPSSLQTDALNPGREDNGQLIHLQW